MPWLVQECFALMQCIAMSTSSSTKEHHYHCGICCLTANFRMFRIQWIHLFHISILHYLASFGNHTGCKYALAVFMLSITCALSNICLFDGGVIKETFDYWSYREGHRWHTNSCQQRQRLSYLRRSCRHGYLTTTKFAYFICMLMFSS